MVVLVSAWLKPYSHPQYFPAGAYLGPFWCFSGSSWFTWGLPPQRVQGWPLFLISLFLHRLYIITRLSWQWICMNNVAVLYTSKSCFVLKHSQVLFVQSWSILKMLPSQQKFGNEKQGIHPVRQETLFQDCKDVVIPGLHKTNFYHCGVAAVSGLKNSCWVLCDTMTYQIHSGNAEQSSRCCWDVESRRSTRDFDWLMPF